ncbi:hypothetical protein C3L33_16310, partial [Rhododendron williamsianum]
MGGCASRPKEFNAKQEPLLPPEDPTTPKKVEGETVSQDKPSIDSSEAAPKTEEPSTESKPAEAEAGAEEAAKPTEDKSEAAVEKKETEEEEKKKEEVKEQGGDAPLVKL